MDDAFADDLEFARALAAGDERALRRFEAEYVPDLLATVRKRGGDAALAADVVQTLRTRLLVSRDGPAKIATYAGRGPLRVWLRVIAARILLEHAATPRHYDDEDAIWELPSPGDHADVEHYKRVSREAFRAAFTEALAALPPRDRTLLRQYHLDGVTLQELGKLYNVHTATAGRWVATARQSVMERTRQLLYERLKLSPDELASVVKAIRSRLDLSLSRLLRNSR